MRGLVLVVLAGCYTPAAVRPCEASCTAQDQTCPDGLLCVADQFCVEPGQPADVCGVAQPPDGPLDPLEQCPSRFDLNTLMGRYAYVEMDDQDFADSEVACEQLGNTEPGLFTHLAAITSLAELQALQLRLSTVTQMADGYIGMTDEGHPGTWIHITGESTGFPLATNSPGWANGEPNNTGTVEHCGALEQAGDAMNDVDCSLPLPRFCECDTHAPVPF